MQIRDFRENFPKKVILISKVGLEGCIGVEEDNVVEKSVIARGRDVQRLELPKIMVHFRTKIGFNIRL